MSRPRLGSVRARTALAASVALAPVLLFACVAGVLLQRHELTNAARLVAEEQAGTVARSLDPATGRPRVTVGASLGGESTLVQVVGPDGRVLAASPALAGRPPVLDAGNLTSRRVTGLVEGEGDAYEAVAVTTSSGDGYVVAAQSLEGVDAATASTTRLLAVGAPLMVLLVAGLSYLLAGRALRPVESMRRRASEITGADLSARLEPIDADDEIARLARTLNEMLERLQVSADAQRQFVADASHELRSPIAAIRTLQEVAAAADPDDVDWGSVSQEVLQETARLEHLVADLLLLARLEGAVPLRVERIDLSLLVDEEARRARRVRVSADVAAGVVVAGDRPALARAVRNLLDNAERHARGLVTVTLAVCDPAVVLRIADDGLGIPVAERARVFERFVRLDESRARDLGGSGLGLPITRRIVEQHGGRVLVVDGEPGAVLEVSLPVGPVSGASPSPP